MRLSLVLVFLWLINQYAFAVPVTRTASNGNWNTAGTWTPSGVPDYDDNVIIPTGVTVLMDASFLDFALLFPNATNTVTVSGILAMDNAIFPMESADVLTVNNGGKVTASGISILSSGLTIYNNIIGPNPFPINGPAVITAGALPITILYFTGHQLGEEVVLEWASASEENFDYYVVERSVDGYKFEDLAKIIGAGFSHDKKEYFANDSHPLPGKIYYRLVAVDRDGSSKQFDVISVDFDATEKTFIIYPNPAKVSSDLVVEPNFHLTENDNLIIYNALGEMTFKLTIKEDGPIIVNSQGLKPGIQIISLQSSKYGRFTKKIILE